ncbi:hypothetical protein NEMIN01_2151 [Nematocida minor]|uniref:uncharacterized protein n=1 Tax=Nematocida minor TaxID=1912983 RepID=UPI0022211AE6|nr:uncharacterized protein NEMIN01_2151 [Nematocida minor]KAI5192684.1 hypothetical protein NEMIN01_2151 [Nematocida minor]
MEHSVSSWIFRCAQTVYILSCANGAPMSLCTLLLYKRENVLYISRMESMSRAKGLGRMVLIENLKKVVAALGYPAVYLYSKPVDSEHLHTDSPISHPVRLCAYWESVMSGIGYESERIGHAEARNGSYRDILLNNKRIAKCLGRIKDEPISRAMKNAPSASMDDIMTILCSSRDLTSGVLLFSKKAQAKERENSPQNTGRTKRVHCIDKITKEDIVRALDDLHTAEKYLKSKGVAEMHQTIREEDIPKREPVKIAKITKLRTKSA